MRNYIITILVCALAILLMNYFLIFQMKVDFTIILSNLFFAIVICAIIISFFSIFVRLVPRRWFNYKAWYFKTFKFETKFYDFLKIKKWKEKIPEMGKTGGFAKNKVSDPKNSEYLHRFLEENCIAEFIHSASILCSFLIFILLDRPYLLSIGLPVFLMYFYLNFLPLIVQRYLRPKLIRLYDRSLKQEKIERAKLEKKEEVGN